VVVMFGGAWPQTETAHLPGELGVLFFLTLRAEMSGVICLSVGTSAGIVRVVGVSASHPRLALTALRRETVSTETINNNNNNNSRGTDTITRDSGNSIGAQRHYWQHWQHRHQRHPRR
jgi:hypothetical protein